VSATKTKILLLTLFTITRTKLLNFLFIFRFPKAGASQYANSLQQMEDPEVKRRAEEEDDKRREDTEEADDPDELARARAMDEFKDNHRRGWGNRHNRS